MLYVGIVEYIVKIDGHWLRSVEFGVDVTLDGRPLHFSNGQKVELGNKAVVSREGNRFTFTTGDGEEVDVIISITDTTYQKVFVLKTSLELLLSIISTPITTT